MFPAVDPTLADGDVLRTRRGFGPLSIPPDNEADVHGVGTPALSYIDLDQAETLSFFVPSSEVAQQILHIVGLESVTLTVIRKVQAWRLRFLRSDGSEKPGELLLVSPVEGFEKVRDEPRRFPRSATEGKRRIISGDEYFDRRRVVPPTTPFVLLFTCRDTGLFTPGGPFRLFVGLGG